MNVEETKRGVRQQFTDHNREHSPPLHPYIYTHIHTGIVYDKQDMDARESPIQMTEAGEESSEELFRSRRRGCFSLPCFERRQIPSESVGVTWWQRLRTAETSSLWSRGVGAVMKIREWSELVAGPRWKTFIRRFNRNRSSGKHANFQYDPLSYAMNFDEGPGHSGDFAPEGDDDGYYYASRNFSSRYAKGSIDLGNDGPTIV